MISTQEIRDKEIINILDGKSLGYVSDIEINLERGRVEALIVPSQRGLFGMFSGADEYVIKWKDIKKIGEDVILAEVREASAFDDLRSPAKADRYKDYRGRNRFYDDEPEAEEETNQSREKRPESTYYRQEPDYRPGSDYRPSPDYRSGSDYRGGSDYRNGLDYRMEPDYRMDPASDKAKETASPLPSSKRQEKEGFFKARTKNTDSSGEDSEIRIRLKDDDYTKMDR